MANGSHKTVSDRDNSAITITWPLLTADHTGAGAEIAEWSDRTIQFGGTWSGATAVVEGSNDGITWFELRDDAGDLIAITSNALVSILETTVFIRPRLKVVGTVAIIGAILLARRPNNMRT